MTRARLIPAAVVAAIAAVASYSHQRDLAAAHGQTPLIAALIPVSVDAMLAVATIAMHEDRTTGRHIRPWAWIVLVLGVGVSVAANTLAAPPHLLDRLISAWPAVALLAVVEVLANPGKPKVPVVAGEPADDVVTVTSRAPRRVPNSAPAVVKAKARKPDATAAAIAAKVGVSERTVQRHLAATNGHTPA